MRFSVTVAWGGTSTFSLFCTSYVVRTPWFVTVAPEHALSSTGYPPPLTPPRTVNSKHPTLHSKPEFLSRVDGVLEQGICYGIARLASHDVEKKFGALGPLEDALVRHVGEGARFTSATFAKAAPPAPRGATRFSLQVRCFTPPTWRQNRGSHLACAGFVSHNV